MTRRHHTSDAARLQQFVFPAQDAAQDVQAQAPMGVMQLSPEQQQQQMMYDHLQLNHSPTYAHSPWAAQGFPPQAFMVSTSSQEPASQSSTQLHSQPQQLPSSSSANSLASVSSSSTASARPRTRSQTKRDAQAATAAAALQSGIHTSPPPVPPLPVHLAASVASSTPSEGTTWTAPTTSIQTRRHMKANAADTAAALPRSASDPSGLGLQGVKTRQRAKREAEVKPPPLSLNTNSPGQLVFPSSISAAGSPQTALSSANQSPVAFGPPHPAWAHLAYTPTTSRTMTPTSTTPSLHSSAYSTSSLSPPSLTSATASSSSSSRRPPKRKAKLTNHLRKEMLEFAEKHPKMTQTDIGIRFEVERSTVSKTLKNRHAILKELEDGRLGPKNRPTKYPDVEEQMTPWVARLTEQNTQITDAMIREKALQIAESLGHTPRFKASVGWVSGFKSRFSIRGGFRQFTGPPKVDEGEDERMEEEEKPLIVAKRRRTEKSAVKPVPDEATEEETEREEESSTVANSSQFSSGFSAISSSSVTTYEPSFDEYQQSESQQSQPKAEATSQDAGLGEDMVVEPEQTVSQATPLRARALSQSSATGASPAHMDGYVSPAGSFEFHGQQLSFSQPNSQNVSSTSSPVQSTLRSDGFLFPALAEEPAAPEQPGTPSTQMSNMVLFTPPQQTSRSGSARNTLHNFVPSTDTIMEDDEAGSAEATNATYQNTFGQLGAPFSLTTAASVAMTSVSPHALSGFQPVQGTFLPTSHSQSSLAAASQTSSRMQPPPLHHAMSDIAVPQVASMHRPNRLQRSRSQSEVLFSSRSTHGSGHEVPTEFRIPDMMEQLHRPELLVHGNSSQPLAYMTQMASPAADPASKLAWLDHTLHQVMGDLSEEELRMFSQNA